MPFKNHMSRLPKGVYVRAWPEIRRNASNRAAESAADILSGLIPQHPILKAVPEAALRLALSDAIQAVSEELALCPGATPLRLLPAKIRRKLEVLSRPELKEVRERAWAVGVFIAAEDEAALVVCQLLFGNWVFKQLGLDHHADANQPAIGALGAAAVVEGVRSTEQILAAYSEPVGGIFKTKGNGKRKEVEKAVAAYRAGQEFGGQLFAHLDAFAARRLDEVSIKLLEVFKGRLETVYDDPEHDPKMVAEVELRLFGERIEIYQQTMSVEMIDDLPEEYVEAASSLDMTEEFLDLIEGVLEPRLQLLVHGAKALFEMKLEEIESK